MLQKLRTIFSRKPKVPFTVSLPDTPEDMGKLDVYSPTWRFINHWAESRLDQLRKKNDSLVMDDKSTAVLRGKIKMIKEVLELPGGPAGKGLLNNKDKWPVNPPR